MTTSIPSGNIKIAPPGKKINQIDPFKLPGNLEYLEISRPKMTFLGQELNYFPD